MNYKLFIILIIAGSLLALVNSLMILFNFDPQQTGVLGFLVFYLSAFLFLFGFFFLVSRFFGDKFFGKNGKLTSLKASLRHSLMFAILLIGWAFMKSQDILRWWNLLLLVLILTVLEFLFISLERERKTITYEYEGENQPTQRTIQPGDQPNLVADIPGRIGN